MKTIEERAQELYSKLRMFFNKRDFEAGFKEGAAFTQNFIPLEKEKPPYEEDILVQTHRGATYFGKMKDGFSGRPDFLRIDCSEDTVSIKNIKSWRPIFYK